MVKVCKRCGIVNSEKSEECESCGAELGAPVKSVETNKLSKQIAKRNEKTKKAIADEKFGGSVEKYPDIPVTPSRIIGAIGCLVAVGLIVMIVLSMMNGHEFAYELISMGVCGLVLTAIAILYCFLPSQIWAFRHSFYWMQYKEMPEPSDMGLVMEQVACAFLILLGATTFVFQLCILMGVI